MSTLIRFITLLIIIATIILAVNFSNYNTTQVPLWIGVELQPQRVGVWLIAAFACGGLLGLLLGFGFFKRIKYQVQLNQLKSQLKKAEKQLHNLKTGPSKGKE